MQGLSSAADPEWMALGEFSDTTKAYWLPPVNRALARSEGVLTVDVYAATHTATGASTCRPVVMDADRMSVLVPNSEELGLS
jgi:hypothetical protein